MKAIDAAESMWAKIDEIRGQQEILSTRPPGAFTYTEYAIRYGLPFTTAQFQVKNMARDGKLSVSQVREPDGRGRMSLRNVYSAVKP